jgi:hypothetical protein
MLARATEATRSGRRACGFHKTFKRRDSAYSSGRSRQRIKSKNPNAPAVKREAEEGWGQMAVRKRETFPPVTMDHIRGHGCRDLLIYCGSGRCHHSATMNGDCARYAAAWSAADAAISAPTCGRIKRHV